MISSRECQVSRSVKLLFLSTFYSMEDYRTDWLQFEVANFDNVYHAILGRPALAKFMAVPDYTYLVMKLLEPNGFITLKGNTNHSYNCEREDCSLAEILAATE